MKRINKAICVLVVLLSCVIALLLYYYKFQQTDLEIAIQQYNDGKYEQAYNSFVKLGEKNKTNPIVLFYLGNMFYWGKGTQKNSRKAFDCYAFAANQNVPEALNNLATCYEYGIGTEKDSKKALTYLQIGSLERQPIALFRLGVKYYHGDNVEKDYKLAFHCFQLVARKSNLPQANYMLGRMYLKGLGVKKNTEIGHLLMHIAAENGEFAAQLYMISYYSMDKNMDSAKKWLAIAQKNRDVPEKFIKDVAEFGKLFQHDEKKAMSHLETMQKFYKPTPLPMIDLPNSNPYRWRQKSETQL